MSEPMLTRHRGNDRRLGPVIVIRGRTCPFINELRLLGYVRRRRSGRLADGGPGHVVPADYVVPVSRWNHSAPLRAGTELLLAQANCAPLARVAELTRRFKAIAIESKPESKVARQLRAGGNCVNTAT